MKNACVYTRVYTQQRTAVLKRSIPMWSLTSDHTHCFLKLGIIKPAKAGLVTYDRDCAAHARAAYPNYGMRCYYRTYGHTHTSVTSCTSSAQIDNSLQHKLL